MKVDGVERCLISTHSHSSVGVVAARRQWAGAGEDRFREAAYDATAVATILFATRCGAGAIV
jgi:hypothetical protein